MADGGEAAGFLSTFEKFNIERFADVADAAASGHVDVGEVRPGATDVHRFEIAQVNQASGLVLSSAECLDPASEAAVDVVDRGVAALVDVEDDVRVVGECGGLLGLFVYSLVMQ